MTNKYLKPKYEARESFSQKYQFLFTETITDFYRPEICNIVSNEESLYYRLDPYTYNEDILDLIEQRNIRLWEVAKKTLSVHKFLILKLYCDGYTQKEVAKMVDRSQGAIKHQLGGGMCQSKYKGKICRYRQKGIYEYLKPALEQDKEFQRLIKEIQDKRRLKEDY
jgi:hypothetical protein